MADGIHHMHDESHDIVRAVIGVLLFLSRSEKPMSPGHLRKRIRMLHSRRCLPISEPVRPLAVDQGWHSSPGELHR